MRPKQQAMYERLLTHLEKDPFFLGYALSVYRAHHGLDDEGLASVLRCQHEAISRLKACVIPNPTGRSFKADVQRIADFASCDPTQLMIVVRQAHVLDSLRQAAQPSSAAIAARDHQDKKSTEEP